MSADTLTPFFLYVVSGLPIVVLFVAASFSEQDRRKNGIVSPRSEISQIKKFSLLSIRAHQSPLRSVYQQHTFSIVANRRSKCR